MLRMGLMAKAIGAKRCLEIGVFTGYSALSVALALPADGKIVALDISKDFTDRARPIWKEAGVADKIDLRIGPALDSLDKMIAAKEGPFDFAFIDADKPNYDGYYERVLKLLRPGGLIAIDNVLWSGAVADTANTEESTKALRALTSNPRRFTCRYGARHRRRRRDAGGQALTAVRAIRACDPPPPVSSCQRWWMTQ